MSIWVAEDNKGSSWEGGVSAMEIDKPFPVPLLTPAAGPDYSTSQVLAFQASPPAIC